jgi:CDP-4-dehydro-6-deoxyglucose reductase
MYNAAVDERTAHVDEIAELAPGIRRITLKPAQPVAFRGGQFISVRVGAGYHPRRSYSIASGPAKTDRFDLVVRGMSERSKEFFDELSVGDEIQFNGPMGFFTLVDDHPGDVVMAATGVGISAILAQLHELLAVPGDRAVELYWGFADEDELFGDELIAPLEADSRFRCYRYIAEPPPGWTGRTGFITDDVVARADVLREPTFYLCGNGQMVADVQRGLKQRGVPRERVRTEVFYPRVV